MDRNLKIILQYDGSAYSGWQVQNRPVEAPQQGLVGDAQRKSCRTVQGELMEAISKVVHHGLDLVGAGRTDRGVHALGQTASFLTESTIPEFNLLMAINSHLLQDIAVVDIKEVPLDFNARFSALGKHYRYTFYRSSVRNVFARNWSCRVSEQLDITAMTEASSLLVGQMDFRAFSCKSKNAPETTVRTVHAVKVVESPPFLFIDVLGRGFLYNMVRTIAGTLLEVGRGKRSPSSIRELLLSCDRRQAGPTAEPQGLCLVEVFYTKDVMDKYLATVKASQGGSSHLRQPRFQSPDSFCPPALSISKG